MESTHLLCGRNVLKEALLARATVQRIFFENRSAEAWARRELESFKSNKQPLMGAGIPKDLREEAHQGIAFECKHSFYVDGSTLVGVKKALLCNHLEDVQNLGSLTRAAVAFGFDRIFHEAQRSVQLTAGAVKASAGMAFRMKFSRVSNLLPVIQDLKDLDFEVLALHLDRNRAIPLYSWTPRSPHLAVVVGSEGQGVSKPILNQVDSNLFIEMREGVESLNVAQSGTIALSWIHHASAN